MNIKEATSTINEMINLHYFFKSYTEYCKQTHPVYLMKEFCFKLPLTMISHCNIDSILTTPNNNLKPHKQITLLHRGQLQTKPANTCNNMKRKVNYLYPRIEAYENFFLHCYYKKDK